MPAKTKAAPKPLAALEASLGKVTNEELLDLGLAILQEGACRADNYVDLLAEDDPSTDALNEGARVRDAPRRPL
jgi:hypothetical protein